VDLHAELGRDAIDRLLAAGHDLKALTEAEQVTYLRWLYRKLDFDPRLRFIILVDGPAGRGEWRREAFLTKPAIDTLRQRHRVRLVDVGATDLQHGVVHTVRASAPGHRAAEVQGFAPRHLPDGTVDPYAYAKARAAARRTAVLEAAAVSLRAYDDLDPRQVRVVEFGPLEAPSGGPPRVARAESGDDGEQLRRAAYVAVEGDTEQSSARPRNPSGEGLLAGGRAELAGEVEKVERAVPRGTGAVPSFEVPELPSRQAGGRNDEPSSRSAEAGVATPIVRAFVSSTTPESPGTVLGAPPRTRPWDARSEFADARAILVLRTLAGRKLRTVHDEMTFRYWLGGQTGLPFAERDPADLSAADIEALTRHLAGLQDVRTARETVLEDGATAEDRPAGRDQILDHDELLAAAMAVAEPQVGRASMGR
jgi:hypothetical protein